MAIKRRSLVSASHSARVKIIENFIHTGDSTITYALSAPQETISYGNPYGLLGKTSRDIGSAFSTTSGRWSGGSTVTISSENPPSGNWGEFTGVLYPRYSNRNTAPTGVGFGIPALASASAMNAYGTTGIARALPTNPLAGLGQFLGELRQVPRRFDPQQWKEALKNLRKLPRRTAEDYLNLQFGWVPLVSDIINFADVTRNLEKHARRLARGSGRHIRRRSTVARNSRNDPTVTESSSAYPTPVLTANYYDNPGVLTRGFSEEEVITFSGAFTYYLPKLPDGSWDKPAVRKRILEICYGTRIDTELLWNLAPWSWAADWIANSGDVIHNWNAFRNDSLVMHYGYVMRRVTRTITWNLAGVRFSNPIGSVPTSFTQTWTSEAKQRSRATPYGFGLNPSSFTAKQWSIIGALGISLAPRSLSH